MSGENLLTENEVARWLKVSPKWLGQQRRAGKIPAIVITPKCIRYDRGQVETWLELKRGEVA